MALSAIGFTGTVQQDGFSKLDGGGHGDGMVGSAPGSSNLRVDRVAGQDRRVTIQAGDSKVPGVRANSNSVVTYDLPANGSGSPRLDWIVKRYSWSGSPGTVTFTHVQGTPAATPARPALVQTAGVQWDVPLSLVRVDAGVGALPADAVTDARYWEYNGVSVVQQRLVDPPHRPGRLLYVASTGELFASNGTAYGAVGPARSSGTPTLETGWAAYGGAFLAPTWIRSTDGLVVVQGVIERTGGALAVSNVGVQIATLPASARPASGLIFPVGTSVGLLLIGIAASGAVTLRTPQITTVSVPSGSFVSLAATFRQ